jgi:hypothetical protein
MRYAERVARMEEKKNSHMLLVGKQVEKRPLGRPRRRWATNVEMDLGEIRPTVLNFFYLA